MMAFMGAQEVYTDCGRGLKKSSCTYERFAGAVAVLRDSYSIRELDSGFGCALCKFLSIPIFRNRVGFKAVGFRVSGQRLGFALGECGASTSFVRAVAFQKG